MLCLLPDIYFDNLFLKPNFIRSISNKQENLKWKEMNNLRDQVRPNTHNRISFSLKIYALFFFCLFGVSNIFAVKFYNINSVLGISTRITNSICKDDNGFIWVTSKTGVLRIAYNDYRIYQLPYESAGVISAKLVYKKSELYSWLAVLITLTVSALPVISREV